MFACGFEGVLHFAKQRNSSFEVCEDSFKFFIRVKIVLSVSYLTDECIRSIKSTTASTIDSSGCVDYSVIYCLFYFFQLTSCDVHDVVKDLLMNFFRQLTK